MVQAEGSSPGGDTCQNFSAVSFISVLLRLISIHTFRLSLTLFFVREKYLGRKVNLHFFRAAGKNCRKRKLVSRSIILVLRIY